MRTFTRYLLLQIPGTLAVALVMAGLYLWLDVSPWLGALAVLAWVLKDLALYPLLRAAFERGEHLTPQAGLVGRLGVAEQPLEPTGYVRVRGELWRARTASGMPIPRGRDVAVRAVEGLTLIVAPADEREP